MRVGSFGNIVFDVSVQRVMTPSEIQRERKARFEEHKVLGSLPRLEFLAPELADMSMRIRLRADMGVNPFNEADRLAKMCKEGKVARLMIMGVNCGNMVLESVSQDLRPAGAKGLPTLDLTLKFKEYF